MAIISQQILHVYIQLTQYLEKDVIHMKNRIIAIILIAFISTQACIITNIFSTKEDHGNEIIIGDKKIQVNAVYSDKSAKEIVDAAIQYDSYRNFLLVNVIPPRNSELNSQFLILDSSTIKDKLSIKLTNEPRITYFNDIEFNPGDWEELLTLSSDVTWSIVKKEIGEYDFVFFADRNIFNFDHTQTYMLHFYSSNFPNVKYVWIEDSTLSGKTPGLSALIQPVVMSGPAFSVPWDFITHYIHFDLPLFDDLNEIVCSFGDVSSPDKYNCSKSELDRNVVSHNSVIEQAEENHDEEIVNNHESPSSNFINEDIQGTIYYLAEDPEGPDRIEAINLVTGEIQVIRAEYRETTGYDPISEESFTAEFPEKLFGIDISPNGNELAFISYSIKADGPTQKGQYSLSVLDLISGNVEDILLLDEPYGGWEGSWILWMGSPAWSPDGSEIAFIQIINNPYYALIHVVDVKTSEIDVWTFFNDIDWKGRLSWELDGAFLGGASDSNMITGSEMTYQHLVRIYPDAGSFDFIIVNANSESNIQIARDPNWSSDSSKVVFSYTESPFNPYLQFNICSIDADGFSNYQEHTSGPQQDTFPYWSPDGRHIVFARKEPIDFTNQVDGAVVENSAALEDDLWIIPIDSDEPIRITNTPDILETYPVWIADTSRMDQEESDNSDITHGILKGAIRNPSGPFPKGQVTAENIITGVTFSDEVKSGDQGNFKIDVVIPGTYVVYAYYLDGTWGYTQYSICEWDRNPRNPDECKDKSHSLIEVIVNQGEIIDNINIYDYLPGSTFGQ